MSETPPKDRGNHYYGRSRSSPKDDRRRDTYSYPFDSRYGRRQTDDQYVGYPSGGAPYGYNVPSAYRYPHDGASPAYGYPHGGASPASPAYHFPQGGAFPASPAYGYPHGGASPASPAYGYPHSGAPPVYGYPPVSIVPPVTTSSNTEALYLILLELQTSKKEKFHETQDKFMTEMQNINSVLRK